MNKLNGYCLLCSLINSYKQNKACSSTLLLAVVHKCQFPKSVDEPYHC